MRQVLPVAQENVDPYDLYRPGKPHRSLLRLNMIASADGRATDAAGRSGGLGGPGDLELFRSLRALADGILVGAVTARVERYGPHRVAAHLRAPRQADGRRRPAPIVVVSRSLELDVEGPLFTEAQSPTVVVTCEAASTARRRRLAKVARVLVAGDKEVDLRQAVHRLRRDLGLAHLLCEGGPRLNQQLLAAGVVDELCLTVAPRLVERGPTIVSDPVGRGDGYGIRDLHLLSVCEQDGELYLRYSLGVDDGSV